MQVEDKLLCHWDLVRFVTEEQLRQKNGKFFTLSVCCTNSLELMIYLNKRWFSYEVRVYKDLPSDKYVPHQYDNVKRFKENDEYATFFFKKFEQARNFVALLGYRHPEYRVRPTRKIGEDT